jgi:hypothetical protein
MALATPMNFSTGSCESKKKRAFDVAELNSDLKCSRCLVSRSSTALFDLISISVSGFPGSERIKSISAPSFVRRYERVASGLK